MYGGESCEKFVCANGLRIKYQYICDDDNDCGDNSDEDRSTTCGKC